LLQWVQPAMVGFMDGSLSTLAPIFAVALATHQSHYAFFAGLATALGAGVSMAFSGDSCLYCTSCLPAGLRNPTSRCRSGDRPVRWPVAVLLDGDVPIQQLVAGAPDARRRSAADYLVVP
jgi:hypothetical protein